MLNWSLTKNKLDRFPKNKERNKECETKTGRLRKLSLLDIKFVCKYSAFWWETSFGYNIVLCETFSGKQTKIYQSSIWFLNLNFIICICHWGLVRINWTEFFGLALTKNYLFHFPIRVELPSPHFFGFDVWEIAMHWPLNIINYRELLKLHPNNNANPRNSRIWQSNWIKLFFGWPSIYYQMYLHIKLYNLKVWFTYILDFLEKIWI